MKKILMIATGGTIASKGTADGLAPELTSQDILHYIPSLKDICEVETLQLCNLDSTNISMEHWMMMANAIEEKYEKINKSENMIENENYEEVLNIFDSDLIEMEE